MNVIVTISIILLLTIVMSIFSLSGHSVITSTSSSHSGSSSGREAGLARGFQPYRPGGEDLRQALPPHFAMDPSYPYHNPTAAAAAAFMHPQHYPHPAFRYANIQASVAVIYELDLPRKNIII